MVLKYTYGGTSVLFTGDIGEKDEKLLLAKESDVSADILKVAHHGSKYSSSEAFLEAVSPEAAVISCGKNNPYGHPHTDTLERIAVHTEEIYRTDLHNSVMVKIKADGEWSVETLAEQKPVWEKLCLEEWQKN